METASAPAPIIQARGLEKSFAGVHAVRGVTFDVPPGQVVGFIGANGAGKTTTMRMLATLEEPDAGTIHIAGIDTREAPRAVRRLIGWMPDAYGTYANVSVFDYLDFYARACGYRGAELDRRVREVMHFADLFPLAERPTTGLSKGMAQRLCFGRALLQEPRVLILDEPAAGLDPKARLEFKNLVGLLARGGTTIFISSHILSELGEMCDALLFIDAGRIVHHGTAATLREQRDGGGGAPACIVDIQVHGPEAPLLEWLALHPGWRVVQPSRRAVRAELAAPGGNGAGAEVLADQLRRMIADGIAVADFHRSERRLEEIFVDVLKQRGAPPPPLPIAQ